MTANLVVRFHWSCHVSPLLRIANDILASNDGGKITFLVLSYLSALAFDNIKHEILLASLENDMGITQSALSWFRSYLTCRT